MKIKQVLIYSLPISSEKGFVLSQSTVSFKVVEKSLTFTFSESLLVKSKVVGFTGASDKPEASSCLVLIFYIHYKYLPNEDFYKLQNIYQMH